MPGLVKRSESRARVRAAAEGIRRNILNGTHPLGSRLPTFDELVDTYGVSRATMQSIIRQLKEEGFVRTVHRSGLFVAEAPPHLSRFGLVFSSSPGEEGWSRFMAALLAEAPVVVRGRESAQIVPFLGVHPDGSGEATEQLVKDVKVHRLAGLMLTRHTGPLLEWREVAQSGIPCVGINLSPLQAPGIPVINTDEPMFYRKALAWLAQRRRKRVAVLAMRQFVGVKVEDCEAAGLQTRPHWICPVGSEFGGQTRSIVRLLLDYPAKERPDALIIATDHLVEEALATIHEAGVVIGRDIDVVAHCNWPWPVESPLPIARLGFHSHQFLNVSLDIISMIRRGEEPPLRTLIPALFEEEWNPVPRVD